MGKIKLNLVSGAIVEKPLICAFKANNIDYVVLDNEMNGSMGLPIILVCKLENNKLIKIADQNEWQIVKEYLKNIIAGSQVELIAVAPELSADDIYYTQLTLPLPSFDALKKAYNIETSESAPVSTPDSTPAPQVELESPVQPEPTPISPVTPEVNVAPVSEVTPTPVNNDINVNPVVTPDVSEPVSNEGSAPVIDLNSNIPTFTEPVSPVNEAAPVVEPVVNINPEVSNPSSEASATDTNSVFKEQKEAFMQACENMFDALVQKFEKELENRK